MSKKFEIQISNDTADHDAVLNALLAFNATQVGASGKTELTFQIKDSSGKLIAGANGFTHWNYFFLAHLWVSDQLRGKGVGRQLMERIEAEAKARNCDHLWLDTFSFQAAGFYEKLGYNRFGTLDNYPTGSQRHFYSKRLV